MNSFLICNFDKSSFANLVKEAFNSKFYDIFNKNQFDYVFNYLKDLGAKSILLERDYLDKDYLEDFSRYYIKSFNNKGPICARLHFFSEIVDHKKIDEILSKSPNKAEELQQNYLGFMVVKPLSKTFIGRTCLKLYSDINSTSSCKKILTRKYSIDLFGIQLEVESIAFQEQDKVVSACATTAIWSALQTISNRSQNDISACSEITTNAINHINNSNNFFPKKELSNKQILRALDVEQLKHHSYDLENISIAEFINHVKIYIDSKIPLILGIDVFEKSREKNEFLKLGQHAVSILGYKYDSFQKNESIAIYVHDDRGGPFFRATFYEIDGDELNLINSIEHDLKDNKWVLVLQLKDKNGNWLEPHEYFSPSSLIIPTHKKIRLSANYPYNTCNILMDKFKDWALSLDDSIDLKKLIHFDLKLSNISDIRKKIIMAEIIIQDPSDPEKMLSDLEKDILYKDKINFLTKNQAKYQWVSDFYLEGRLAFSILFDATQVPQENPISSIYYFNKFSSDAILSLFIEYSKDKTLYLDTIDIRESFYLNLLDFLKGPELNYLNNLNDLYGGLRAPKYIKVTEFEDGDILNNPTVVKIYHHTNAHIDEYCGDVKISKIPFMLWAVSEDGALILGKEIDEQGHPCLTGFKSARIAGEIHYDQDGWKISSKSGRYSTDYINSEPYLHNSITLFKSLFKFGTENLSIKLREN